MKREAGQLDALLELSKRLEANSSLASRFRSHYLTLMYHLTRLIERVSFLNKRDIPNTEILNFGCGVNFIQGVNSDLLPLHRFLKGSRRPDIYLSGTYTPPDMKERFQSIICEHVLEHVLPTAGLIILKNLYQMLKPGGRIQICVPRNIRFVSCAQGEIQMDVIGINEITYNHWHQFMYDATSLEILMRGQVSNK